MRRGLLFREGQPDEGACSLQMTLAGFLCISFDKLG